MMPDTKSDFIGTRFSKTWCVLPWTHAASLTDGSTLLCCVAEGASPINLNKETIQDYWNSEYIQNVRKNMLEGKKVSACRRCYEEEANNYRSHRLIENKAWHDKLGFEFIDNLVEKTVDGTVEAGIVSLDLRLGNTCNLQCIMCQPRESSKWVSLAEKVSANLQDSELKSEWNFKKKIKLESYEWYKNTNFWSNLKKILPSIREIIIAGGEPMLIKQHLSFLKECAESGEAGHIHVRYHTNLLELPAEMIPFWKKFERVEMFASIDGMENIANYIRHPSEWNKIVENLEVVDNMADNTWLRFLFSVQALNIYHLPDFIRWVRAKKFKKQKCFLNTQSFIHPGLVHWPEYLNPKILPPELKKEITEKFSTLKNEINEPFDKFDGIVSFMNSEDWFYKKNKLLDYCRALDTARGTSFKKTFPEIAGIMT